jgi:DNA processing protein
MSGSGARVVSEDTARRRLLAPGAPEWPDRLEELGPYDPPRRLYVEGRSIDPARPAIAIVGTRRPTAAGVEAAADLARGVSEAGFTVVSGLAVGIDASAHRAALDGGGHTIAVLGCGLDVDYPARNRQLRKRIAEDGTLVTEYSGGTRPTRFSFPLRNRIIAGLSLGVVVVEGSLTSGALVTARLALDANRSVYAVPGSLRNAVARGPNELIRTGRAALVSSVDHIFEDLAPHLVWRQGAGSPPKMAECTREERTVLAALDDSPLSADRLTALTGLAAGCLAATAARLEVRGLAVRSPGGVAVTAAGARARA